MGDGGNGLSPVALAAGEVAPGSVDVPGLLGVAFQGIPGSLQVLEALSFVKMTPIAGIGNGRVGQAILGQQTDEDMAVDISGFGAAGNPGHVATFNEQRRIGNYLDGLQTQMDALKKFQTQTAAELDALLPAILDRAFKGNSEVTCYLEAILIKFILRGSR